MDHGCRLLGRQEKQLVRGISADFRERGVDKYDPAALHDGHPNGA